MMRHREDCFGDDAVLREILDSRGERRGKNEILISHIFWGKTIFFLKKKVLDSRGYFEIDVSTAIK